MVNTKEKKLNTWWEMLQRENMKISSGFNNVAFQRQSSRWEICRGSLSWVAWFVRRIPQWVVLSLMVYFSYPHEDSSDGLITKKATLITTPWSGEFGAYE